MSLPQYLSPAEMIWTYSGQWIIDGQFNADKLKADVRATLIRNGARPIAGEKWKVGGGTARAIMVDVEDDDHNITVNTPTGLLRIPFEAIYAAIREVTPLPIGYYDLGAWNGDAAPFQNMFVQLRNRGVFDNIHFYAIDAYMTGDAATDVDRWGERKKMVRGLEKLRIRNTDPVFLILWNRRWPLGRLITYEEAKNDRIEAKLITPNVISWTCDAYLLKRAAVYQRSKTTNEWTDAADPVYMAKLEAEIPGWVNAPDIFANLNWFENVVRSGK